MVLAKARKNVMYLSIAAGICIILGALTLSTSSQHLAHAQWLTEAGGGLMAPACGSSAPATTCVGSSPRANVTYDYSGVGNCGTVTMTLSNGGGSQSSMSCSGTFAFSGLNPLTAYTYSVSYTDVSGPGSDSGSFSTPSCTSGTHIDTSNNPIVDGGSTTITWDSGASTCKGVNFSTGGAPSGSKTVSPTDSTDYSVNCNDGTSATTTVTVFPASISLTANPSRVRSGTTSTLIWDSTGATSCRVTGVGVNATGLSGSTATGIITTNTLYTLTCQTSKGQISTTANVGPSPVFTPI